MNDDNTKSWNEGGQRFFYEGTVIRTLKPGLMKMSYGDTRLREIRAERAAAEIAPPPGRIRRVLSGLLSVGGAR